VTTVNTEDRSPNERDVELVARVLGADLATPWPRAGRQAKAVLAALTAAGRLRAPAAAADDDEQTARSIFRAWLEHCGYTAEQITEIDAERDHSTCDMTDDGWGDCTDADGESNHRLHNETQEAADLIMFTLEALAGRLLPEGGGERTEWAYPVDRDGKTAWIETWLRTAGSIPGLSSRSAITFPDGRVLLGAWVEVPTTPEVTE